MKTIISLILLFCFNLISLGNYILLKKQTIVYDESVRLRDIAILKDSTDKQCGDLIVAASPEMDKSFQIYKQENYPIYP